MNFRVVFFLLVSMAVSAQQTMVIKGSKPYPATESWNFICENYALSGLTNVQIAKTEKGGSLRLAVETTNPAFTISGMAYVFLDDNTIITCSDKGNREVVGNQIVTYYSFSAVEMAKLKKNRYPVDSLQHQGKCERIQQPGWKFHRFKPKRIFCYGFRQIEKKLRYCAGNNRTL